MRITHLISAVALSAATLGGAAFAGHTSDHGAKKEDHSAHSAAEHAAASSAPAKIVDAFAVALTSKDARLVKKLLADDVVIAESGGAERGFAEYEAAHMGADMMFMSGVKERLVKRDEYLSGDFAVVVSEKEVAGEVMTKPVSSRVMETMVLKKDGESWRIQHIHWSTQSMNGGHE